MTRPIRIDRAELTKLTQQGWTIQRLAKHFECNPRTISRLRQQIGINVDKRRFMTPERRATIQAMYDDGWSSKEIHLTEGAHPETLARHFPGHGWTTKQRIQFVSDIRKALAA